MSDELDFNLKRLEQIAIQLCLEQTNGNKAAAARLLGIGRASIFRKLKKYEHSVSQEKPHED